MTGVAREKPVEAAALEPVGDGAALVRGREHHHTADLAAVLPRAVVSEQPAHDEGTEAVRDEGDALRAERAIDDLGDLDRVLCKAAAEARVVDRRDGVSVVSQRVGHQREGLLRATESVKQDDEMLALRSESIGRA